VKSIYISHFGRFRTITGLESVELKKKISFDDVVDLNWQIWDLILKERDLNIQKLVDLRRTEVFNSKRIRNTHNVIERINSSCRIWSAKCKLGISISGIDYGIRYHTIDHLVNLSFSHEFSEVVEQFVPLGDDRDITVCLSIKNVSDLLQTILYKRIMARRGYNCRINVYQSSYENFSLIRLLPVLPPL